MRNYPMPIMYDEPADQGAGYVDTQTEMSPADAAAARINAAADQGMTDWSSQEPAGDYQQQQQQEGGETELDSLIPENMLYRDAKKLINEVRTSREKYRPFEQSFGSMSDNARQALMDYAPDLGDTLGASAAALASIDPSDRTQILAFLDAVAVGDTNRMSALINGWGQALGGQQQPAAYQQPTQPDYGSQQPGQAADDPNRPITVAELQQFMAEQQYAQQQAIQTERQMVSILDEARQLGYNPETEDLAEQADFLAFAQLAASLDGDMQRAHEMMQARRQSVVDQYLQGKRADAANFAGGADMGTGPSNQRPIESMSDARNAASARLESMFGPDRNRRPDYS